MSQALLTILVPYDYLYITLTHSFISILYLISTIKSYINRQTQPYNHKNGESFLLFLWTDA